MYMVMNWCPWVLCSPVENDAQNSYQSFLWRKITPKIQIIWKNSGCLTLWRIRFSTDWWRPPSVVKRVCTYTWQNSLSPDLGPTLYSGTSVACLSKGEMRPFLHKTLTLLDTESTGGRKLLCIKLRRWCICSWRLVSFCFTSLRQCNNAANTWS